MRISSVRLDTGGGSRFEVAPSPPGRDGELWATPAAVRDMCGLLADVLANEDLELVIELEALAPPARRIWIEGLALPQATMFASAVRAAIVPSAWHAGRAECRIALDAAVLRTLGVVWGRSAWSWQWRRDGGHAAPLGSSEHLIFVAAGRPTFPWSLDANPAPDTVPPWAGALALACEFGAGAVSVAEVPRRVQRSVCDLEAPPRGSWRYDSGTSEYLNPGIGQPHWFHCALFIAAVRGLDTSLRHRLSCFEAAAVVVTFANLLGSALEPMKIQSQDCEEEFGLNAIWPLGQSQQTGTTFARHVVAADTSNASAGGFVVYDAVLRLDTDASPSTHPHTWAFPAGVPVGQTTTAPGTGHLLPQLILEDELPTCVFDRLQAAQIAEPEQEDAFDPCTKRRQARYLTELLGMRQPVPSVGPRTFAIAGFLARAAAPVPEPPFRVMALPPIPPRTRTAYVPIHQEAPGASGIQLIADFWTGDMETTRSFMSELLATADRPPRFAGGLGGIVYAARDGETLWMLLDGAVARLSSVGPTPVNLMRILAAATPV